MRFIVSFKGESYEFTQGDKKDFCNVNKYQNQSQHDACTGTKLDKPACEYPKPICFCPTASQKTKRKRR